MSRGALVAGAAAAFILAVVMYCQRLAFVFSARVLFPGFAEGALLVAALNAVFRIALAVPALWRGGGAGSSRGLAVASAVSWGLLVVTLGLVVILFAAAGDSRYLYGIELRRTLPLALALLLTLFFAFCLPFIPSPRARAVTGTVLAVGIAGVLLTVRFQLLPVFAITTTPVVFDTGDVYHVVWATSTPGTGFVTYEYAGETCRVYDAVGGMPRVTTLHTVRVPRERLDGAVYRITSTKVADPLSYGTKLGETVSAAYRFTAPAPGGALNAVILSDYHNKLELLYRAAGELEGSEDFLGEKPGLFIINGDCADCLNDLRDVIDWIVRPAGRLSGGAVPVIFVRGNHEARGAYAAGLAAALGFDRLYYQVGIGAYRFTVLDTGEDKDDADEEYGGLADFGAYMEEELAWLAGAAASPPGVRDIALVHEANICFDKGTPGGDAVSNDFYRELERLGVELMIAGDWHRAAVYRWEEYGDRRVVTPSYPAFIDGGVTGGGFVGSAARFTPAGAALWSTSQVRLWLDWGIPRP